MTRNCTITLRQHQIDVTLDQKSIPTKSTTLNNQLNLQTQIFEKHKIIDIKRQVVLQN